MLVTVLCGALAHWQWQRGEQKQQRLDNIETMRQKGLLDWSGVNSLPLSLNKTGLQLSLQGRLDRKHYWLLDNRTLNGRSGFDLLVLFYPLSGEQALLVNLGWLAQGKSRRQLPEVKLPEHISIKVQLKQGELAGFYLAGAELVSTGWPKLIQFIDIATLAEQSGAELVNYMAYAVDDKTYAHPHYQPVVMAPQKHQAYALQWLLIGLAAVCCFIFALRSQSQTSE
ncbi:SURF1 family protein [Psychromonas ossibalaenae]|uniref:SURF1 family protein n=1 Tax=Psychromonas ossibalaenae TaxID=444922 RepID=UPI000371C52D|nr:SURF1 family protein [Psychromonas ossibalaenae]